MTAGLSLASLFTQDWLQFIVVALLGFLTGLELRGYFASKANHYTIGTSRTYTFIAILGYVFATLDPLFHLYLAGMLFLSLLFGVFYFRKLQADQHGILQLLIGLLVYTFGPVAQHFPPWFLLLLFVAIVFVLNARPVANRIIEGIDRSELMTLTKFILLAGVVLPLLPDTLFSPYVPISPFRIWLGVVAISGISYTGYILKRYIFREQGYVLTGLVGGLYSSTATTVVLARKSREASGLQGQLVAAIIAASGMMYMRLLLLVLILKPGLLSAAGIPLLTLGLLVFAIAGILSRLGRSNHLPDNVDHGGANPLELGVALLFSVLFVAMISLTHFVISYFGQQGLALLSVIVGFTDIDPFVLSLLNGHYAGVIDMQLAGAVLIAAGANNILKGLYAVVLGERRSGIRILLVLTAMGLLSAGWGYFIFTA